MHEILIAGQSGADNMSSQALAAISFACMLVGILFGHVLRWLLRNRPLDADAKDVVKLCTGLITTVGALVLGLAIGAAKTTYDSLADGISQNAANIAYFDRLLAQYGPETAAARKEMRQAVIAKFDRIWGKDAGSRGLSSEGAAREDEAIGDVLLRLRPRDEADRVFKARALQVYGDGVSLRWRLFTQLNATFPVVFLVVIVFWFTLVFALFALLSTGHRTVNIVMILTALSVSAGILLTLDMSDPFEGFVTVSSGPLEAVLRNLGR